MKKLIGGLALGLVVGAGAVVGALNIPSVNSALSRVNIIPNNSVSSSEDLGKDKQIADLETENMVLKSDLSKKDNELTETKTLLASKESLIVEKEEIINSLNTEIEGLNESITNLQNGNANLEEELERYKELAGADVNYIELISTLQTQLDTKKSELDTANAELTQLRVDKETLTARVAELEEEVAILKQKLADYETVEGELDTLSIANYNGTWYQDGEFKDYYKISDGIVVHNNNVDNGVINVVNSQMIMFLSSSSKDITLSNDGMSFVTEDGLIYKKAYINTFVDVSPELSQIAGTYNLNNETLKLNADNTLSYTDESGTYYGAYVVKSQERNIGGNKQIYNYITATINKDDTQITREFKYTSYETYLTDEDNVGWEKTEVFESVVLSGSSTEQFDPSTLKSHYVRVRVKTPTFVDIKPNECVCFYFLKSGRVDINGVWSFSSASYEFYSSSNATIRSCYFDFYFKEYVPNGYGDNLFLGGVFLGTSQYQNLCTVVDYDIVGYSAIVSIPCQFNKSFSSLIDCSPIEDYVSSSYVSEDNDLSLNLIDSENGTITIGENEITATSVTTNATTDGYDIYHDVTIKYTTTELVEEVETEVEHTIILKLKNNNLVSSTLDEEDYTLTKK